MTVRHAPPVRRRSSPRLRRLATVLLLAGVAAVAACDSVTEPVGGLTGRWASTDGHGRGPTGAPMTLELEQHGGAVTGTGSFLLAGETVALDVAGTIDGRVVVLTLTPASPGGEILLQGMLADDRSRLTTALTLGASTETRIFGRQ